MPTKTKKKDRDLQRRATVDTRGYHAPDGNWYPAGHSKYRKPAKRAREPYRLPDYRLSTFPSAATWKEIAVGSLFTLSDDPDAAVLEKVSKTKYRVVGDSILYAVKNVVKGTKATKLAREVGSENIDYELKVSRDSLHGGYVGKILSDGGAILESRGWKTPCAAARNAVLDFERTHPRDARKLKDAVAMYCEGVS